MVYCEGCRVHGVGFIMLNSGFGAWGLGLLSRECKTERERKREKEKDDRRERKKGSVCVCV